MKQRKPALHEETSSQGDNEEVGEILCNPSSLSVLKWSKRKCQCSLETAIMTSDLGSHKTHTHTKPKNQRKRLHTVSLGQRGVENTEQSELWGVCSVDCCLLRRGWPFYHHVALQDSDKTSWDVTRCPCGGHNAHTGDTHMGAKHTQRQPAGLEI